MFVAAQVDTVPLPEEDNPWHSAFMKRETDLTNEASAARVVDSTKARFWKIKNPAKRHVYSGKSLIPSTYGCSDLFGCLTWLLPNGFVWPLLLLSTVTMAHILKGSACEACILPSRDALLSEWAYLSLCTLHALYNMQSAKVRRSRKSLSMALSEHHVTQ